MKDIDSFFYSLPIVGIVFRRNYSFFKKHTAVTNGIHVALGIGIGLLVAGGTFHVWGVTAVVVGIVGHIYAFIRG